MDRLRGQSQIVLVVILAICVVVVAAFIPLLSTSSVQAAIYRVESTGEYVVLTMAQYNTINAKLDAIKVDAEAAIATAEAAVTAAEAAVVAAELAADKVDLFNSAEVFVYPATTTVTCVLTAGNTNVWGNWTEIVDSGAVTLSSKFATNPGYVSDIHAFLPSDANDGYNLELAYGDAKVTLGRIAFWVPAGGEVGYQLAIKSRRVPVGETVYYRLQSTGANGATVQVRIRYFHE